MKTKHIWIVSVLLLLAVVVFFLVRKVKGALNLTYSIGKPKPVGSWLESLSGLKLNIPIVLKNFAPDTYKVSQVKAELYTRSGNLIASQSKPLDNAFYIASNSNSELPIPFDISLTGLTAWFTQEKISLDKIPAMIKSFFGTEKLGLPATVKGFIAAEGLTVNINEDLTI